MKKLLIGLFAISSISYANSNVTKIVNSTYESEVIEISCFDQSCDYLNIDFRERDEVSSKIMLKKYFDKVLLGGRVSRLKNKKVEWNEMHLLGTTLNTLKVAKRLRKEGRNGSSFGAYLAAPIVLAYDLSLNLPFSAALTLADHVFPRLSKNYTRREWKALVEIDDIIGSDQVATVKDVKYDTFHYLLQSFSRNKSSHDSLINLYFYNESSNCSITTYYNGEVTDRLVLNVDGEIDSSAYLDDTDDINQMAIKLKNLIKDKTCKAIKQK
jgi:hypothetical protein